MKVHMVTGNLGRGGLAMKCPVRHQLPESPHALQQDARDPVNPSRNDSDGAQLRKIRSDSTSARDLPVESLDAQYLEIDEARLEAVPWTLYCREDQEKHDRIEHRTVDAQNA